jgi:hypothetical protein
VVIPAHSLIYTHITCVISVIDEIVHLWKAVNEPRGQSHSIPNDKCYLVGIISGFEEVSMATIMVNWINGWIRTCNEP